MSRTSRRLKFDYYGRSLSNARVYRTEQNSISYSFSSITNITALCLYLFEAYSIKSNKFLKNYFRSTEQKPPKDDDMFTELFASRWFCVSPWPRIQTNFLFSWENVGVYPFYFVLFVYLLLWLWICIRSQHVANGWEQYGRRERTCRPHGHWLL